MPIQTLPEQTETSLGQEKTDVKTYSHPETQVSAPIWNRLVLRVIEAFGEIGLSNGATAGSLNARVKTLESNVTQPGDVAVSFSDFKDAATGEGWKCIIGDSGDAIMAPSITSMGFPSSGVVLFAGQAGGDTNSRISLVRSMDGLNCDSANQPVLEFRILRPQTIGESGLAPAVDCMVFLGAGAGTITDDGPPEMVGFMIQMDGTYGIATLKGGDFEDLSFVEGANMPSSQVVQIRVTIGNATTASKLEASGDDGATYTTLAVTSPNTSAQVPTQSTYYPYMLLNTESGVGTAGPRIIAIDWVKTAARRSGSGAGAFDGEHALKFPKNFDCGDYTPTLTPPSSTSITLTQVNDWLWTKIGRVVRVSGSIIIDVATGSESMNGARFSLPFKGRSGAHLSGALVADALSARIHFDGSVEYCVVVSGTFTGSGNEAVVWFEYEATGE